MQIEKVLSKNEVLGILLFLSLVYVFPIIRADYAYVDDNWRSLLLADDGWRTQGRVLLEWLNKFLAFNGSALNIFPLPLLIATCAMALAMTRLVFHYFPQPRLVACLVVFPLLGNPFFLGNISYQFDGPGMMLAVVAAIYAVTCEHKSALLRGVASALLVVVILSLYQPIISVFVGLCLVEYLWNIRNRKSAREILSRMVERVLQLLVGGALYYLTAYQMANNKRGDIVLFDQQWIEVARDKFLFSMDRVMELINSGNALLAVVLLLVASVGFAWLVKDIRALAGRRGEKMLVLGIGLCTIPVLVISVPGVMLFVAEPFLDARNFVSFSVILLLIFLLAHECLGRLWHGLRLLLIIPVLWMFSFCYAYGQVIIAKKELETAMATYVAHDLIATPELRDTNVIYYVGPRTNGNWLPRGHGAMISMPTLRYILSNANIVLHPQFLTRLGINNVVDGSREVFEAALLASGNPSPMLERKFYSFYVTKAGSFIVMKEITDSEAYVEQP